MKTSAHNFEVPLNAEISFEEFSSHTLLLYIRCSTFDKFKTDFRSLSVRERNTNSLFRMSRLGPDLRWRRSRLGLDDFRGFDRRSR